MGKDEKTELARNPGKAAVNPSGPPQPDVRALLEAGQTLNALTMLAFAMVNEAALMLDTSTLLEVCAARVPGVTRWPLDGASREAALRSLVVEAIKELLTDEHVRVQSHPEDSAWDDFGGAEKDQLQSFGMPPEETRRNAARFNALPLKTRQAFFAVTRALPAGNGVEQQAQLGLAKESSARCAQAMKVLLGREAESDE